MTTEMPKSEVTEVEHNGETIFRALGSIEAWLQTDTTVDTAEWL